MTSLVVIIAVPGGAVAGPNATFGSAVQGSGDQGAPYALNFDFSNFMGPDDMLNEYIATVITPGGLAAVNSDRTGRPLSQVNTTVASYPAHGSCTVTTTYARSLTLSF